MWSYQYSIFGKVGEEFCWKDRMGLDNLEDIVVEEAIEW